MLAHEGRRKRVPDLGSAEPEGALVQLYLVYSEHVLQTLRFPGFF